MPRYLIPLAVVVEADSISDVNDDAIGEAVVSLPGVAEVHGLGVTEYVVSDDDRTVWADVADAIHP